MTWKIKETRRGWASSKHEEIRLYQTMEGRIPIPELIATYEETGVDWRKVELNYATATWTEPPTQEEVDKQALWDAQSAARTEKWERETLARLTAKYGAP